MLFSVGYRTHNNDELIEQIIRNKQDIYEVYFSWGTNPSGRNDQTRSEGLTAWEAQEKQIADLKTLSSKSLKFNVLFNANCYGENAQSRAFFSNVGETVEYIGKEFGLQSLTTTSPLIAKFIKQNFPEIDVRASVNMGIGSILGLEYLAEYFNSFYIKRECIAIPQRKNPLILNEENTTNPEVDYTDVVHGVKAENQIDFVNCAVQCGLGERSKINTVLTDEYGPFIRYCFIFNY
jgi:hypothetical protein